MPAKHLAKPRSPRPSYLRLVGAEPPPKPDSEPPPPAPAAARTTPPPPPAAADARALVELLAEVKEAA